MEKDIKQCKSCNETKLHILDKKYDYKNKRYIDQDGLQWNGKTCGKCHVDKMKIIMKSKRGSVKV